MTVSPTAPAAVGCTGKDAGWHMPRQKALSHSISGVPGSIRSNEVLAASRSVHCSNR